MQGRDGCWNSEQYEAEAAGKHRQMQCRDKRERLDLINEWVD
jgi:hypothetical protein